MSNLSCAYREKEALKPIARESSEKIREAAANSSRRLLFAEPAVDFSSTMLLNCEISLEQT